MACTIDHLHVDQRVTVLRDFADLAGVGVRAGETALIRGLGMDYGRMEVLIELERHGRRDRLRFALRAPDGPRIGRMKDYFEVDETIATPPAPVDSPPARPPHEPRGGEFPSMPAAGPTPPAGTALGERSVACGCDPVFHRPLLPARGEVAVHACLRCGMVTASRSIGDDGRFTGQGWRETLTVSLPEPVLRWIAGWPRVRVDHTVGPPWPTSADLVRYPTLFYPADARCDDPAELDRLEARLAREQAGQSVAERQRATHRVRTGPPPGLPADLQDYAMLWEALQLRPDSRLPDLFHLAQPRSLGRDLAAEVIRRRPDAWELLVDCLRSRDVTRRGVGFMVARDWHPPDPRLPALLIELLGGLSLAPVPDEPLRIAGRGEGEMLLLLVAELRLATPEMLATLRALMRQLGRHDAFLVDCLRHVLHGLDPAHHAAPGRAFGHLFLNP